MCKISDVLDDTLRKDFNILLYIRFSGATFYYVLLRTDIIECGKFYFHLL